MINKRKAIEYLECRIVDLEAQETYYFNKHDNTNDVLSRALTGLRNIKKIIEDRLED